MVPPSHLKAQWIIFEDLSQIKTNQNTWKSMTFYRFTSKAYSTAMLSINFHLYQLKVPKQLIQKFLIFSKILYFQVNCLGTLSWYKWKCILKLTSFKKDQRPNRCNAASHVGVRNRFIELSSELAAPILDQGQKNFRL